MEPIGINLVGTHEVEHAHNIVHEDMTLYCDVVLAAGQIRFPDLDDYTFGTSDDFTVECHVFMDNVVGTFDFMSTYQSGVTGWFFRFNGTTDLLQFAAADSGEAVKQETWNPSASPGCGGMHLTLEFTALSFYLENHPGTGYR